MELLTDEYRILSKVIDIIRTTTRKDCNPNEKTKVALERLIRDEFLFDIFKCSRCKKWFSKKDFTKGKGKGLYDIGWCLECSRETCKNRYWRDPEKARARNRVLYRQAFERNPEVYKEKNRRNYKK